MKRWRVTGWIVVFIALIGAGIGFGTLSNRVAMAREEAGQARDRVAMVSPAPDAGVAQLEYGAAEEERPPLDVPYVPTPQPVVDRMLEIVRVTKSDMVYDLGCGDGRLVVTAAKKYGAKGLGVDIDPQRIRESNANAKSNGVTDRVTFMRRDLFTMDLYPATVMTMYLLPEVNLRLRPKMFEQLRPGARVVSHDFDMGDWKPDRTVEIEDDTSRHTLYYWVMPAKFDGTWNVRFTGGSGRNGTLRLKQKYQEVDGTLSRGSRSIPVTGKLIGREILLTATETVNGKKTVRQITGTIDGKGRTAKGKMAGQSWTAKKA